MLVSKPYWLKQVVSNQRKKLLHMTHFNSFLFIKHVNKQIKNINVTITISGLFKLTNINILFHLVYNT